MALTWTAVSTPNTGSESINDILSLGGGKWVAVGTNGTVLTSSDDGATWIARTAAENNYWTGLATDGTTIVAVALNGTNRVMTSTDDGVTWTAHAAAEANSWNSVVYVPWIGSGMFIAVDASGAGTHQVMTSSDSGATWTARTHSSSQTWFGIAASGSLVMAFANSKVMTSTDGVTWTDGAVDPSDFNQSIGFGNNSIVYVSALGKFAIPGHNGAFSAAKIALTADGTSWSYVTAGTLASYKWVVGYAVASTIYTALWSFSPGPVTDVASSVDDGATWTVETTGATGAWFPVAVDPSSGTVVYWDQNQTNTMLVGTAPSGTVTVTRVIPSLGRVLGRKLVLITGTNFLGTPVVTFDGTPATDVVVLSSTRLRARTPAHAAGLVDVTVDGVTLANGYRYTDAIFGDLTIRQEQGITIDKELNDAPDQCSLTSDGVSSVGVGAPIGIVDPASGATLFGGTALVTTDGIDGTPTQAGHQGVQAGDLTWRLNARRPVGTWINESASDVYQDLIDQFAPQFTGFIEAGLPAVSLACDRSQTLSETFSALAKLAQCSWRPDDDFGVHVFTSGGSPAPGVPPDDVTDDTCLYDPPPTVSVDITQIRNRIYVKGAGGSDAEQTPATPPVPSNMTPAPTTGGSIPNAIYEYSMTSVTEDGEGEPVSYGYGGVLNLLPSSNNAFALSNLDATVVPDARVIGRNLYRNRSTEDTAVPVTTNCVTRQYLVTSLANQAGIGEDTFFDGVADASLTQLAPNVDTTATIFAMVEDTAAQAALAAIFGDGDDGVREGYITDTSLVRMDMATARGNAELALFASPITTVVYACRDEKSVPGEDVNISLTKPPVSGIFKLQRVRIDQIQVDALGMLFPRFTVTASSVRFTLDDLLRKALIGP